MRRRLFCEDNRTRSFSRYGIAPSLLHSPVRTPVHELRIVDCYFVALFLSAARFSTVPCVLSCNLSSSLHRWPRELESREWLESTVPVMVPPSVSRSRRRKSRSMPGTRASSAERMPSRDLSLVSGTVLVARRLSLEVLTPSGNKLLPGFVVMCG